MAKKLPTTVKVLLRDYAIEIIDWGRTLKRKIMQLGDVKKSLSWRLIEECNEIKKGWLYIISREFPKEKSLPKPTKRLKIDYSKVWKGKLSFKS